MSSDVVSQGVSCPRVGGFVLRGGQPRWEKERVFRVWERYYSLLEASASVDGGRVLLSGGSCCSVAVGDVGRDVVRESESRGSVVGCGSRVGGVCSTVTGLGGRPQGRDGGFVCGQSIASGSVCDDGTRSCASVVRDGVGGSDGSTGVRGGESTESSVDLIDPLEGLTGRARRKKKRALKLAAKVDVPVEPVRGSELAVESSVEPVVEGSSVVAGSDFVPEWRVRSPKGMVHKGFFSGCSEERQRELRDTRAAMLVAKNKAEAVKAEAEARRVSAQMKSQEIERSVELRRLETEAKLKTAVESKFGVGFSSGFAKTVIEEGLTDIIPVPLLDGSGSVSPDSSVSVAMVRRLEKALQNVSEKLAESEKKLGLLSKSKGTAGAPEVQGSVPKGFRGIITVSPAEEAAMFDRMHAAEHMSCHDGLTQYAAAQLAGEVPNEPLGAWGPRGA